MCVFFLFSGAYVTYMKSDDALRAIQSVNNITIDGRLIKSSLGTTKYCSHFMKNAPCPKPDCMYLHDLGWCLFYVWFCDVFYSFFSLIGDPEASFTKEQMHAGKHQEYEKKLHEALLSKTAAQAAAVPPVAVEVKQIVKTKPEVAPPPPPSQQQPQKEKENGSVAPKESWPQLEKDKTTVVAAEVKKVENNKTKVKSKVKNFTVTNNVNNNKKTEKTVGRIKTPEPEKIEEKPPTFEIEIQQKQPTPPPQITTTTKINIVDDNSSFFSQNTFHKLTLSEEETPSSSSDSSPNTTILLSESLPDINSTEDWEAAFGFTKHSNHLEELAKQRNGSASTILDALTTKTAFVPYKQQQQNSPEERLQQQQQQQQTPLYFGVGVSNGFKFSDFYKNGYSEQNNYLMMQQKRQQLEEYFHVKHGAFGAAASTTTTPSSSSHLLLQQQQQQQNGVVNNSSQFLNFDVMYQTKGTNNGRMHAEDELDFDPFQETQKGLAELLENEQNIKLHSNSTGKLRGKFFFFLALKPRKIICVVKICERNCFLV